MGTDIREIPEFAQEQNAVVVELIQLHHDCGLLTDVGIPALYHISLSVVGVFHDHKLTNVSTSSIYLNHILRLQYYQVRPRA